PSGSRNSVIFAIKNAQHVIPAYPYVVQYEIFWQRNNVPELPIDILRKRLERYSVSESKLPPAHPATLLSA
ncbi:MAG: hypothetical protein K4305_09715, partial [Chlorobium sp.]|uniref:hypothetical protein n=1 Tax=Chlorobium sp. TaxID=1095 RepID=UPI002F3F24C2